MKARQLSSSTGVPTPFKVAYEIYSEDCDSLGKRIHLELRDFRVNPNTSFFEMDSDIKLVPDGLLGLILKQDNKNTSIIKHVRTN